MKADRDEIINGLKSTFADVYSYRSAPREASMTPKQELAAFMAMSPEDRYRMAMELGPEQWNQEVMKRMDQLTESLGPAASKLFPWVAGQDFMQQEPTIDRAKLEAELLTILRSRDEL
jgi:hypothetical protein